jgi:serine/threonine protein kinase
MLSYKVSKDFSEIMMTHGGNTLDKWIPLLKDARERSDFAAEMLRQIISALKILHKIGYSHGDLKPSNICVRQDSKGRLKFTLIDFGICQKLPLPGSDGLKNKHFRGNLMFCSD